LDITLYLIDQRNPKTKWYTMEYNLDESIRMTEQKTTLAYLRLDSIQNDSCRNDLEEVRKNTEAIVLKVENLKEELFINEEEKIKFTETIFNSHLIRGEVEDLAMRLENDVSAYRRFMLGKAASLPELKTYIEKSIQFGTYDFNNKPPVIYNNCNRLIRDIRMLEYEVITGIADL
jgi:hypothetical protein